MVKYCILGNTNNPVTNKLNEPYSWFVKSFRDGFRHNGHEPLLINYKTHNINQIKEILLSNKVQFVFTHLTFHGFKGTDKELNMYKEVTKRIGTKFIHVCGDARKEDRYMGDISSYIHMAFVTNYDLVRNCEPKWKIPVHYAPYSSLTYDIMGTYKKSLDVDMPIFTGSDAAHGDRKKYIEGIKKHMKIMIYRTQSKQDTRDITLDLSASNKCILGLCTGYDVDGFIDVRPFQYLGTGACMIIRKFKNMDDVIPDDLYYPITSYDNPKEIKDIWEEIIKTDTTKMRTTAFRYIQRYHSSQVRIKQIIDKLEGL